MNNNDGDVSKNVSIKKSSRFFQLCHGYFNSLKTSNCMGTFPWNFHNLGDRAQVQDGRCCVYVLLKRSRQGILRSSRAVTVKKCTKKIAVRKKMLFYLL